MIWAVTTPETGIVETGNGAEEDPAGMVTEAPTVMPPLLDDKVTTNPPVGAGPVKVAVPVVAVPPVTVAGARPTLARLAGLTVTVPVCVVPLRVPVTVAGVADTTADVETVNVAVVAPARTFTEAGTVALGLFDVKLTVSPPVGATPLRVTVPVEFVPPVTLDGARVMLDSPTGLIVKLTN